MLILGVCVAVQSAIFLLHNLDIPDLGMVGRWTKYILHSPFTGQNAHLSSPKTFLKTIEQSWTKTILGRGCREKCLMKIE